MSWSIDVVAHFTEIRGQLIAELAEVAPEDHAHAEAAARAVLPFLSLIGDPAVDPAVSVTLSGNGASVSMTVTAVPLEVVPEANPNDTGTVQEDTVHVEAVVEPAEEAEAVEEPEPEPVMIPGPPLTAGPPPEGAA